MVEKTRRALTILQQRDDSSASSGIRCQIYDPRNRPEYDAEVRKHASELVAHAIRSTEDRVAEVKRKAGKILETIANTESQFDEFLEEAVMEVRKAAVTEVQRAVATAESKAQEMVNAERSRMESILREVALREAATGGEQKVEPQQVRIISSTFYRSSYI